MDYRKTRRVGSLGKLVSIGLSQHGFLLQLKHLLYEAEISFPHGSVITRAEKENDFPRKPDTNPTEKSVAPDPEIGRVILYMEKNLNKQLSLQELTLQTTLTKYQLIRKFQSITGFTPWKYLIEKRIENAKSLLENGLPPGRTALECGFYDQSHFTKTFKEITGLTPVEYQKKNFKNRN